MSTIGECINKMWYDLTVEFYLAIKRNLFFEKKIAKYKKSATKGCILSSHIQNKQVSRDRK